MSDVAERNLPTRPARTGFGLLVSLIAIGAAAKAILFDTIDPDCFWHLRVADQLRADGIGPIVDRLSFASIQQPWSPYSWLAELGMKAIWDGGGYRLAVLTQAFMQAALVFLTAIACRWSVPALAPRARYILSPVTTPPVLRPSGLACAVATAVSTFLSLPYLSFRPVTAALLLLAACAALIFRDRAAGERTRAVWLAPALAALMVNLHLYAIFVPAWFGAMLIGALWERIVVAELPERSEAERRICRYFGLLAASAAACCLTPMLPGMVATAMHYQSIDPMVASGNLAEMRPFFLGTMGTVSGTLVIGSLLFILARFRWFRPGERLLLGMGVVFLSQWGRLSPVFALVAAPMLAIALRGLSDRAIARWPVRLAMSAVLIVAIIRVAAEFPARDQPLALWMNRHGAGAPGYPDAAAGYIAENVTPRTGRLISEFTWGGYLEWRLGDRYQLFLDGRTQLFTPEFWQATYLGGARERATFLGKIDADAAVLPAGSSLFRHALISRGWVRAWHDERSEVLIPPQSEVLAKPASSPNPWPVLGGLLPE